MAGYSSHKLTDITVNEKNSAFEVGDMVHVVKEHALPNFDGKIEKKYTNSALVAFKPGAKISQQMFEDFNGHYVVNYDKLKVIAE
ncbi:hypothetical protein IV38_GL000695 [Lactobacillus selangorensis]|uniref:DUF2187 domain-containing protein n=1 Tax=Lactobacillus selangorensis TaxID=81857 RepID=A0A0R2FFC6_9LACO|nr:hypothetical protein [Lactobacillus selangorensis]KRN27289.1 hypothetical protein IV38_GL000695 [Lactobacillus selangorensis]KRN29928.1 hypothetical protein IV40_GL000526 [Lactobacillus selangorensis]